MNFLCFSLTHKFIVGLQLTTNIIKVHLVKIHQNKSFEQQQKSKIKPFTQIKFEINAKKKSTDLEFTRISFARKGNPENRKKISENAINLILMTVTTKC